MPAAVFIAASLGDHRDALLSIHAEYMSWVLGEMEREFGVPALAIIGSSVAEYVAGTLDGLCGEPPPRGVFYLIDVGGEVAGMGGLRAIGPGVAEIKRLYVRPACRGMELGTQALAKLLADASRFGYRRVCLDSAPFMKAAHRLYEAQGFIDCAAYDGTEVPSEFHARWRFMQRLVP